MSAQALKAWMDAKEEMDNVMNDYNNKIDRMQELVRERQQDASELHRAFSTYKWQDARHIMSGKRLSCKLLDELQAKDIEAYVDIERLRIEGRQLGSQLKKIQLAILKKDQLSDALFAVDYEQLRIENESLNDKVIRRNTKNLEIPEVRNNIESFGMPDIVLKEDFGRDKDLKTLLKSVQPEPFTGEDSDNAMDDNDKVEAYLCRLENAYKQFKTNICTWENIQTF
ncbi:hypothetical protein L7F22_035858 [Adiantum nelumboides]|nr:hypothetical protein [Adiantum nelumboides]